MNEDDAIYEEIYASDTATDYAVALADGIHCRFCGADAGEAAPTSSEYRQFWADHEARSHKLETITSRVGRVPTDEIVRAILTELL